MDLIKEALDKARAATAQRVGAREHLDRPSPVNHHPGGALKQTAAAPVAGSALSGVPLVRPDGNRLERNRIVSFTMTDPSHVAFNVLRTKVQKVLQDNGWKSLAITSPTAGCGKTTVSINLALSLARQPHCRTLLVDLDLGKSGVADSLGISAQGSIGGYLDGRDRFEDCFVRLSDNLILGLNLAPVHNPAEMMHGPRMRDMLKRMTDLFGADVTVFDLPPMLANDEAIAFLPQVDASLLVIGGGETTATQIEECERHLHGSPGYLGVCLNKSADKPQAHYYGSKQRPDS